MRSFTTSQILHAILTLCGAVSSAVGTCLPCRHQLFFPQTQLSPPVYLCCAIQLFNYSPGGTIIISTGQNNLDIIYTNGGGRHYCGIITRNNFSHLLRFYFSGNIKPFCFNMAIIYKQGIHLRMRSQL